jgi:predicted secreted Zn-dependent protease
VRRGGYWGEPFLQEMSALTSPFARLALCIVALSPLPVAAQSWEPIEKTDYYRIRGNSPMALYQSIGERGPLLGGGRTIAHTTFKLTWQRDYQQQGSACVLASAKPKLIITYTLPKPADALPADVQAKWDRFFSGIVQHEKLHGVFMRDLTQQIQDISVGLRDENDPGCKKVRAALQAQLKPISDAHGARHSEYDRVEMSPGGAVHQLILGFVNP